jgi:hypothetical protein
MGILYALYDIVAGYHMYNLVWLQETILSWYGVEITYALYNMVAGNHIKLVWCGDTICTISYDCRKPY